jgi:adenylate kinase
VLVLRHIMFLVFLSIYSSLLFATKTIIFLGPPGSGKTTQSSLLKDAIGWRVFSSSNIFKKDNKNNSELHHVHQQFKNYENIIDLLKFGVMIREITLAGPMAGVILDSWPKNLPILKMAKRVLFGDDTPLVIELLTVNGISERRATKRIICPNSTCGRSYGPNGIFNYNDYKCQVCNTELYRKNSDNAFDFPRRILKYSEQREAIFQAFKEMNIPVVVFDGDQSYTDIHKDILALAKEYVEKK